jgi:hypothetical protein
VVEEIGALADDTARAVAYGLESDLTGLFDYFLRDLASTACKQPGSTRILALADSAEGIVEACDLSRTLPDLCVAARKRRLYGGVGPYQGSRVPFLHSQVGDVPTRVKWRTALAADLYCARNRSDQGTPSPHPGQVVRGARRKDAIGRLRGSFARSRSHLSVAIGCPSLDTEPGMPRRGRCQ